MRQATYAEFLAALRVEPGSTQAEAIACEHPGMLYITGVDGPI